jgi:hypothetical protein
MPQFKGPRFVHPFVTIALVVLSVAATALAEPLTRAEREKLWEEARRQLRASPRLVYHNGDTRLPDYPSFIMTNETGYWTMNPGTAPSGIQVGFATMVNFNLLALRRNETMVVADQSE